MAVIEDPKLKAFIETGINDSFGLSVDEVAEKCKGYGRFRAWLNSDVTRIKEVLNKVKSMGVSPGFFASYERSEGYNSKWGWLNHTRPYGNPVQDAESVCKWIKSQSKDMNSKPAWIDYANYKDFVPKDIQRDGNAHFKSIKSGAIGRVLIAGTAAATWEVYYPLGLKKEYNGVQNYAPPLKVILDSIEQWGGSATGGSGDGVQLAVLMCHGTVIITQAEGGSFSHDGSLSVDFAYAENRVPLYAPFDMTCKYVGRASEVLWQSDSPVMCADGTTSYVTFNTLHDNDYASKKVGDKMKKGQVYAHTGVAGNVTGDHTHIECSKGKFTVPWHTNPKGNPSLPNPAHIYDVFSSCDNVTKEKIKIINNTSTPMPFKCILDFVDGEGGDGGDDNNNKKDKEIIHLLLCNALNGWYNY